VIRATREERLKANFRNLIMVQLFDLPAVLMLAFGLLTRFSEQGALLPFLENDELVDGMIVTGALILLWCSYRTFILIRERGRIMREMQEISDLGVAD